MTQQFIETNKAVFCVAFSPDGHQLAAGTGSYYGLGELLLYPFNTIENAPNRVGEPKHVQLTRQRPHHKNPDILARPEGLSATALCFTPDNQQLWVATSASYREQGPLFCFELSSDSLHLPVPINMSSMRCPYPDGFVHFGNQLFICCHSMDGYFGGYIYHFDIASVRADQSQSQKLLLIDGQLITPGKPHPTFEQDIRPEKHAFKFGLSFAPLNRPDALLNQSDTKTGQESGLPVFRQHKPSHIIPVEQAILCMAQQPDSDRFITGNSAGQLHHWWFEGQWHNQLIEPEKMPELTTQLLIMSSSFTQNCVVAIQYLPNNRGWLSLHANGLLIHWLGHQIVHYEQVSHLGTPRCLTLHPTKPLLAIGLKHNADLQGAGILLADISAWL
ncbi:MAG: hypothetical protein KKB00_04870 [Gammaproteobacteria bacterium]|nr:hypothetical protein [Gammaproteobacteria bacterium]